MAADVLVVVLGAFVVWSELVDCVVLPLPGGVFLSGSWLSFDFRAGDKASSTC